MQRTQNRPQTHDPQRCRGCRCLKCKQLTTDTKDIKSILEKLDKMVHAISTEATAKTVKELKNSCPGCLQQRIFFNVKSPYSEQILQQHGPDDLVATTVSQFPLSHVVLDETGPIFFGENDSEEKDLYLSTHLLICVELVTY